MPAELRIGATRIVEPATGGLTLDISDSSADFSAFGYDFLDETGMVTGSMEVYGEDSVQALRSPSPPQVTVCSASCPLPHSSGWESTVC